MGGGGLGRGVWAVGLWRCLALGWLLALLGVLSTLLAFGGGEAVVEVERPFGDPFEPPDPLAARTGSLRGLLAADPLSTTRHENMISLMLSLPLALADCGRKGVDP